MKTVQILIQFHGEDDQGFSESCEMNETELYAMLRYISKTRISSIEVPAIIPIKDFYDAGSKLAKRIKNRPIRPHVG